MLAIFTFSMIMRRSSDVGHRRLSSLGRRVDGAKSLMGERLNCRRASSEELARLGGQHHVDTRCGPVL